MFLIFRIVKIKKFNRLSFKVLAGFDPGFIYFSIMCTVTLTPLPETSTGFILTSNRDEAGIRETLPPDHYVEKGVRLLYPRDKVAGGTWIGLSSHKRLICLLNGEFEDHERILPYRLSRGVVVKDLLTARDLQSEINLYDLHNIEPFTIIAAEWKSGLDFIEFVWDGKEKHLRHLDKKSQIWSSSPLYTSEMKAFREDWFLDFQTRSKITPEGLWEFHHSAGKGDNHIDVIMDRGFIKTQSITQVIYDGKKVDMIYEELNSGDIVIKGFRKPLTDNS